jgi:hypothetical protein
MSNRHRRRQGGPRPEEGRQRGDHPHDHRSLCSHAIHDLVWVLSLPETAGMGIRPVLLTLLRLGSIGFTPTIISPHARY